MRVLPPLHGKYSRAYSPLSGAFGTWQHGGADAERRGVTEDTFVVSRPHRQKKILASLKEWDLESPLHERTIALVREHNGANGVADSGCSKTDGRKIVDLANENSLRQTIPRSALIFQHIIAQSPINLFKNEPIQPALTFCSDGRP